MYTSVTKRSSKYSGKEVVTHDLFSPLENFDSDSESEVPTFVEDKGDSLLSINALKQIPVENVNEFFTATITSDDVKSLLEEIYEDPLDPQSPAVNLKINHSSKAVKKIKAKYTNALDLIEEGYLDRKIKSNSHIARSRRVMFDKITKEEQKFLMEQKDLHKYLLNQPLKPDKGKKVYDNKSTWDAYIAYLEDEKNSYDKEMSNEALADAFFNKRANVARKKKENSHIKLKRKQRGKQAEKKHYVQRKKDQSKQDHPYRSFTELERISKHIQDVENGLKPKNRIHPNKKRRDAKKLRAKKEKEQKKLEIEGYKLERKEKRDKKIKSSGIHLESSYSETLYDLDISSKFFSILPDDINAVKATDLVINFVSLCKVIHDSKTKEAVLGALKLYLSTFGLDVITLYRHAESLVVNCFTQLMEFVSYLINDLPSNFSSKIHTESLSDYLDTVSQWTSVYLSTKLVTSLTTFITAVVSMKFFSADTSYQFMKMFGKLPRLSISEFLVHVYDVFRQVLKVGELILAGTPISEALLAEDPLETCLYKANLLLAYKDKLYRGTPVDGYMQAEKYRTELEQHLKFITDAKTKLSKQDKKRYDIEGILFKLVMAKSEYDSVTVGKTRMQPLALMLTGEPGIGKGSIETHIFALAADVLGMKYNPNMVFTKPASSQYYEGYNPQEHPFFHLSEVGSIHENLAATKGDEAITDIMTLIDNQPYLVNMAFAKASVYASPKFVLGDSNNHMANSDVLFSEPMAFLRRWEFVEPIVKLEYKKAGGIGLDINASLSSEADLMDKWHFRVWRYEPGRETRNGKPTKQYRKFIVDGKETTEADIYTFSQWFHESFKKHLEDQTQILARLENDCIHNYLNASKTISVFGKSVNNPGDILPTLSESQEPQEEPKPLWCGDDKGFHDSTIFELSDDDEKSVRTEALNCPDILDGIHSAYSKIEYTVIERIKNVDWRFIIVFMSLIKQVSQTVGLYVLYAVCFSPWFSDKYTRMLLLIISLYTGNVWFSAIGIGLSCFPRQMVIQLLIKAKINQLKLYTKTRVKLTWKKLLYYCNCNDSYRKALYHSTNYMVFGSAMAAVGLTFIGIKMWLKKRVTTESEVILKDELATTFHLGRSYKRIKNKNNIDQFNIMRSGIPARHKGDPDTLETSIARNIRVCKVYQGKDYLKTHYLGLEGNYAVINTHAIPKGGAPVKIVFCDTGNFDVDNTYERTVSRNRIYSVGEKTIIQLKGQQFSNVLKHISADLSFPKVARAQIRGHATRATYIDSRLNIDDPNGVVQLDSYFKYEHVHHKRGDCGIPLIIKKDSGSAIVGIHTAGDDNGDFGYAAPMTSAELRDAIDVLKSRTNQFEQHSEGMIVRDRMDDPVSKSIVNRERLPYIDYFGKLPGSVLMKSKSKLVNTQMEEGLLELYHDLREKNIIEPEEIEVYKPPMMGPTVRDGVVYNPYDIAMKNFNSAPVSLNEDLVEVITDEYLTRIIKGLEETGLKKLEPLTMDAAINGVKEDQYINRLNVKAAAGYGYPGKKSQYLDLDDEMEDDYPIRRPNKEVEENLRKIIQKYLDGDCAHPYYKASLKDEPRPASKAATGKTRVFYADVIDFLIICRMFLLPVYTLLNEHSEIFGTAIGIDMRKDAHKVFNRLKKNGKKVMEGDYGKYDQTIPFDIRYASSTIIYEICKHFGYNEAALKVVRGILSDSLFPMVVMNQDLMRMVGLQPSGKFGTAEDNSIVGVLIAMYIYYSHEKAKIGTFFENVSIVTYGDDILQAVSNLVSSWYNNNYYQEGCAKIGMKYTSASKSEILTDFMDIKDSTFLKRKFFPVGEFVAAPLMFNSIIKSLSWVQPSDSITTHEQLLQTVQSTSREIFLHTRNEKNFNYAMAKVIDIFVDSPICVDTRSNVEVDIPSYHNIVEELGFPVAAQ
jgi:hypothetical protein